MKQQQQRRRMTLLATANNYNKTWHELRTMECFMSVFAAVVLQSFCTALDSTRFDSPLVVAFLVMFSVWCLDVALPYYILASVRGI
jgi:hypothetical protein